MSSAVRFRWSNGALDSVKGNDPAESDPATSLVDAADSWFVTDGRAFALELHRERFIGAALARGAELAGLSSTTLEAFWEAVVESVPATGDWFPRVALLSQGGTATLEYLERPAPPTSASLGVMTHHGADPRRSPRIKGPDLAALALVRDAARRDGAEEAVILTDDGYIVEGATTSIVWWRGNILCAPPESPAVTDDQAARGFARIDSVTERSLFGLASVLGVEIHREPTTPTELDGAEVWALNALHGIRIVTQWRTGHSRVGQDATGPALAELPGRLALWRHRRDALLKPMVGRAA